MGILTCRRIPNLPYGDFQFAFLSSIIPTYSIRNHVRLLFPHTCIALNLPTDSQHSRIANKAKRFLATKRKQKQEREKNNRLTRNIKLINSWILWPIKTSRKSLIMAGPPRYLLHAYCIIFCFCSFVLGDALLIKVGMGKQVPVDGALCAGAGYWFPICSSLLRLPLPLILHHTHNFLLCKSEY